MGWAEQQIILIESLVIVLAVLVVVGLRMVVNDNILDQSVMVVVFDGELPS